MSSGTIPLAETVLFIRDFTGLAESFATSGDTRLDADLA
jgi:hypothetical protein